LDDWPKANVVKKIRAKIADNLSERFIIVEIVRFIFGKNRLIVNRNSALLLFFWFCFRPGKF
jgi:hypothetical protein